MTCRVGCGACCIAPSISTPLPKMPEGKPAGVRCAHLTAENLCELFGLPTRPAVCVGLQPEPGMCGADAEDALRRLTLLEIQTTPRRTGGPSARASS
ncbi:MAG: YkgJ family cysteine cluster protein [Acidobacteria bacterium]|nr:YkgJ family cysteine cluster protein [Acidobacteriota bacterium]